MASIPLNDSSALVNGDSPVVQLKNPAHVENHTSILSSDDSMVQQMTCPTLKNHSGSIDRDVSEVQQIMAQSLENHSGHTDGNGSEVQQTTTPLLENHSGGIDDDSSVVQQTTSPSLKNHSGRIDDDDFTVQLSSESSGTNSFPKNANDRQMAYELGQNLLKSGDRQAALKAFLRSLHGLESGSPLFPGLPQCLRDVATCYYEEGNFLQAVHFIQAEKLYYENALLESGVLQSRIMSCLNANGTSIESVEHMTEKNNLERAAEYESLSRFCLDKKQSQLALEYCAKATQLRKEALGDEHPLVKESLALLTAVYAEQGKTEYNESLRLFDSSASVDEHQQLQQLPASILKSPNSSMMSDNSRHVRFDETSLTDNARAELTEDVGLRRRRGLSPRQFSMMDASGNMPNLSYAVEEFISRAFLLILFLMCCAGLCALLLYAYCNIAQQVAVPPGSPLCHQISLLLHRCAALLRVNYFAWSAGT